MSKPLPSEILNNHLLATIERQRRIICNLLIKNQEMRTRLMRNESNGDEPEARESMRSRRGPRTQSARFGQTLTHGVNHLQVARSTQ
jgi:hypothetical protein